MNATELAKKIKSKEAPVVVDVRTGVEFRQGHIPGAIHAPALKILLRLARLPKDKSAEIVITCEHGPRAVMAQGILTARGYRNTSLLDGHVAGWKNARLPLEK